MRFIVQDIKPTYVHSTPKLVFEAGDTPQAIHRFYQDVVEQEPGHERSKEHVVVVTLNTRVRITGWNLVSIGGLSEAYCHPREVLRPVIVRAAHSFVLIHNHPSGDPTPSAADIKVTRRLKEASDLIQIALLDHVIVGESVPGRSPYYSFREGGLI